MILSVFEMNLQTVKQKLFRIKTVKMRYLWNQYNDVLFGEVISSFH